VCSEPCDAVADCSAAPPGGTAPVQCQDVTGDGNDDCILSCSAGQSCPTDMICFQNALCMWN
jgi:hypothetical protein